MSSVPNTNELYFNNDIQVAVYGNIQNGRTLLGAFADANDNYFNPSWVGSKTNMLNFRDYGPHNDTSGSPPPTPTGLTGVQVSTRRAKFTWTTTPNTVDYEINWDNYDGFLKLPVYTQYNEWTSPEQNADTEVLCKVRARNANGVSGWAQATIYLP